MENCIHKKLATSFEPIVILFDFSQFIKTETKTISPVTALRFQKKKFNFSNNKNFYPLCVDQKRYQTINYVRMIY